MKALTYIVAGVITNSGKCARRFDLHVLHREDTTKTTMKVKVKDNRHQAELKKSVTEINSIACRRRL